VAAQRFLPPIAEPVLPAERYHVVPKLGPTRAEARIKEEICEGTFRPHDAAEASTIEEAYALFVPFWRVDIQKTDQSVRLSQVRVGTVGIPIPRQDSSEAKATWMVCARTAFPYEMKHPSTLIAGDAKPLSVSLVALAAGEPDTFGGWEVLDADVSEQKARDLAAASLSTGGTGSHTLFTESQVTVRALHFVRYPIWLARYRYRGEATPVADDLFYVGISAVDGAPITAEHPSKLRAGAAKVRRFFRFE
jgi:hypothetical protein